MAHHDAGPYLRPALDSVFGQTLADFELIVVDDCSGDGGYDYLRALRDPRVTLIRNPRNIGQTASLNIALEHARAPFVARFDADDVCEPDRLRRQVEFLERNRAIDLLGTQVSYIDAEDRPLGTSRLPTDPGSVWAHSLLQAPFVHPAVMLRGSMIRELGIRYDERYINQDFELWSRLLPAHAGANLGEALLRYRIHDQSMTVRHLEENLRSSLEIVERRLEREGLREAISLEEIDAMLRYLFADRAIADGAGVDRLALAERYWRFCTLIARERGIRGNFLGLAARRVVQSGVWPRGLASVPGRLALLARLCFETPGAVALVLCDGFAWAARRLMRSHPVASR